MFSNKILQLFFSVELQVRERFLKESAFEDVTLEAERKRIFKDFMHVLEVGLRSQRKRRFSVPVHEDRRRNIPCFPPAAAARMPAPPLEDEEALQEVQEAPQEAVALSIGSSSPLSLLLRRCCRPAVATSWADV